MASETPEREPDDEDDQSEDEEQEDAPVTRQVVPDKTGDVRPNR